MQKKPNVFFIDPNNEFSLEDLKKILAFIAPEKFATKANEQSSDSPKAPLDDIENQEKFKGGCHEIKFFLNKPDQDNNLCKDHLNTQNIQNSSCVNKTCNPFVKIDLNEKPDDQDNKKAPQSKSSQPK